eukprot:169812-Prorocentrum_minimum.AAC.1
MLKTTLATDAVIGAMTSPDHAGSAYVLLHHVMGEAAGKKGVCDANRPIDLNEPLESCRI